MPNKSDDEEQDAEGREEELLVRSVARIHRVGTLQWLWVCGGEAYIGEL